MARLDHNPDDPPFLPDRGPAYSDLLHSAEDVAARAVDRLRRLSARYPDAVPGPLVDLLDRLRAAHDRRGAVRLAGDSGRVTVRTMAVPPVSVESVVLDRSAGGLSLGVPVPLEAGAFLEIEWPTDAGDLDWYPAQVRHVHPCDGGWAVGCEFLGGRPPA